MKKKEQSKYILGVALIGVWGLLGYRVYQKFNPQEIIYHRSTEPIETLHVDASEPYALMVNYRDPFLEGKVPALQAIQLSQDIIRTPKRPKHPLIKKGVIFPEIEYKGNVKTNDGRITAVVRVNQSVFNWRMGETYKKLELIKIYEDSIRVAYNGEEKLIEKVR